MAKNSLKFIAEFRDSFSRLRCLLNDGCNAESLQSSAERARQAKDDLGKLENKVLRFVRSREANKNPNVAAGPRAKAVVMAGRKERTTANINKQDLTKNAKGRVVSKKAQKAGKEKYKHISAWSQAVKAARAELGISGFCVLGGRTKLGRKLLSKARQIHSRTASSARL
eukprot:3358990-Karenia_brevis.AAC.1